MLGKAVIRDRLNSAINKTQALVSQLTSSEDIKANSSSLTEKLQTTLDITSLLSIYSHAVLERLPVKAMQFVSDDQVINLHGQYDESHFEYAVMLYADDQYLGQMLYQFKQPASYAVKLRLEQMHKQLTFPLRNAMTYSKVRQAAVKDHLTGVGNRSLLDETLAHITAKLKRDPQKDISIVLIDMDNFKQVNDNFGHQLGDEVLQQFAQLIKHQLRDTDRVFRYGGDEFVLVLEDTPKSQVTDIIERLEKAISHDSKLMSLNVAFSSGSLQMESFHTADDVLDEVDKRLYEAKSLRSIAN
ncbi:signal protein [Idiomarina sp. WRN-38]|jgi:diguanylate cyclase (GGDEF)-like protein|uniref:GGDEF domain-containing protein n=1 Tax=Idiomarina sp. OXR-189 TaxID=3100175 RepID=UPI000733754B|nr:GGDEF domain-containing protein [Idiomarina sp. OXR-189]KTG23342.1 signal protein [Idiomarina sp. H105]OAE90735.1 signal protein [Idiomarina sp. WRN-38]WPZ00510.1 GGDEF domain-containing protein [Idiomarina sp. OXR-189]|tara:strand:- start:963 stop:1862 length:900 start_codon:yes stop_codon:yes gene_type:complete